MAKIKENKYMPTIAIPPGETIKENLEVFGMSQIGLSASFRDYAQTFK